MLSKLKHKTVELLKASHAAHRQLITARLHQRTWSASIMTEDCTQLEQTLEHMGSFLMDSFFHHMTLVWWMAVDTLWNAVYHIRQFPGTIPE